MGIGQGENGKESEGCFALRAEAAASLNPVVTLVMSLFAPSAMADDRIAQTLRTPPNDLFCTGHRPVKGWVAMIDRKWDKENRVAWALPLSGTLLGTALRREPSSSFNVSTEERQNNPTSITQLPSAIGRLSAGFRS
jgi:hypothetical protein